MKIAITLLVALLNLGFAGAGAYNALQGIASKPIVAFLFEGAGSVVPFLATAVFAIRRAPRWLWVTAFVCNLLLVIVFLWFGVMGSFRSSGWFLQSMAFVGIFPAINLAYLLAHLPSSVPPSDVSATTS